MTTTVAIDKKIRDMAAKKAKEDNLSVSAVIRLLLTDYADGKIRIGTHFADEEKFEIVEVDKKTRSMMDDVIIEWNKK